MKINRILDKQKIDTNTDDISNINNDINDINNDIDNI
jgi:hypothetical protein